MTDKYYKYNEKYDYLNTGEMDGKLFKELWSDHRGALLEFNEGNIYWWSNYKIEQQLVEYVPPVVHKATLVWYLTHGGKVTVSADQDNILLGTLKKYEREILSVQEVEFTEKK